MADADSQARPTGSASIEQPDYWWYQARAGLLEAALGGYLGTPRRLLDVGSADAPSVRWTRGDHVSVSLDIDPRGLPKGLGVCGSLLALPFADGSFDVVGAFDVVEHCDDEARALQELSRVLTADGRLLMSVPAYQWAWSSHDVTAGHYRRYTRRRLRSAVERASLTVDRATYAFASVFPFFATERLARRLAGRSQRSSPAGHNRLPAVSRRAAAMFTGLCSAEAGLVRRRDLPFGSSVFLAARKQPRVAR